jgi:hypothetical protein
MKKLVFALLCASALQVFAQPSLTGNGVTDGSIHVLGNGKMCIYELGPDIVTSYTGPYSTPSYFTMQCLSDQKGALSVRRQGTAIWTHTFTKGNDKLAELGDFVDAEIPCFVRHVQTSAPMIFRLKLEKYVQLIDNSTRLQARGKATGRLMIVPPGTTIYQTYVFPRLLYGQLAVTGAARIEAVPDSAMLRIICEPGESYIYLVGGPGYADVISNTKHALSASPQSMLERTDKFWQEFTARRTDFNKVLNASLPQRDKLIQTIDEVAVLIKAQQSTEGAVLAGYPYPLGYVRDQYGVSRGLLVLGLTREAKSILNFYWVIWKKYGYIHNAQGIGVDGIFHIHENDEVEITGYLILQAFDLLRASKDTAFVRQIAPMLDWAFESQKKHLVNGMLPFNGDETYVAGGMLPRSTLNDGSAEATMLFTESGQQFLDWAAANHLWNAARIAENQSLLSLVRSKFKENFWKDGVLWTNNPDRATSAELPLFRHGVCEMQGPGCLMTKYGGIVWTERNENNRYLCASCINGAPFPKAEVKRYNLLSVALAPFYMNLTVMPFDQLTGAVYEIRDNFITTGAMTSKQEMANQKNEIRTVGYDYGFLLNALTMLHSADASRVYDKTLSVVDQEGSWSEYYLNDKPSGTRCRPWESAINIEAVINWAKAYKPVVKK